MGESWQSHNDDPVRKISFMLCLWKQLEQESIFAWWKKSLAMMLTPSFLQILMFWPLQILNFWLLSNLDPRWSRQCLVYSPTFLDETYVLDEDLVMYEDLVVEEGRKSLPNSQHKQSLSLIAPLSALLTVLIHIVPFVACLRDEHDERRRVPIAECM